MRSATCADINIDRAACASLIRNYVDTRAEFAVVTDEQTLLVADAIFAEPYEYFRRNLTTGRAPS